MLSRERERMSNVVAWIEPTGRANARLMTGSAKSGSSLPRISLRSIRATQITPGVMGPRVREDDELVDSAGISDLRKIILTPYPNHRLIAGIPSQQEGRLATSRNAGRDAVDACVSRGERHGCVRRSRVVLTPGLLASSP